MQNKVTTTNIAINKQNRVVYDTSIIANNNGTFYDFNGGVLYKNEDELLSVRPDLKSNTSYQRIISNTPMQTNIEVSVENEIDTWKYPGTSLNDKLFEYLPFEKNQLENVLSNCTIAKNGELAIKFRDSRKIAPIAVHYRHKVFNQYEWRMLPGSDAFAFEALPAGDIGYVYVVFGSGDFLTAKLLGLRYLAFGSDIAIKGNRAKIEEIKATINAGRKTPATVRLIHDNDDSGRSTVQSFIDNGFKIEVFNWSLLKDVDTHKWDLKDLVYYLKDLGQDEDGIVEFLENKNNYKGNNNE